ncbi:MAG: SDR family oxidoreductase [Alphaproteobacteria bacterium]|nr:SDR family oxidoreductase [Alphaproteobacteria bacterium]
MAEAKQSGSALGEFPQGVAVVIGGSGGIGKAVSLRLAECGCSVAFSYNRNVKAAEELAAKLKDIGRDAYYASLDISSPEATQAFFDVIKEKFGRIHTVVVATGANIRMAYIADVTFEEWRNTIDGDLNGFFNVIKAAIPVLRQGGGSIVGLTSAALVRHSPQDILSTAPKGGIESLIRGIAREEGRYGIRANSVALGVIDAGLMDRVWNQLTPQFAQAMKSSAALRRIGTADEAADAVVFLASSRASFITGQRLVLDGGYSV